MAHTSPILIGPRNAEDLLGLPWRRVRGAAAAAGLTPIRLGRSYCYEVDALLAALRAPANESEPLDPAAEVRRRLGVVRRGG